MARGQTIEALSLTWNKLGRDHATSISARLADFHEGRAENVKLDDDPRDAAMASRVVNHVQRLNGQGRWRDARSLFDPAHEPLIPLLDELGNNLPRVAILGPNEFLVRTGTSYTSGKTLHLAADGARERSDMLTFAVSPDHDTFLVVTVDGFKTKAGLDGTTISHWPWPPECNPQSIDEICVANGGRRIAFADEGLGMWVGSAPASGPRWVALSLEEAGSTKPSSEPWSDSMMHCALSPDGDLVATGSQCADHCIDVIDVQGDTRRVAVHRPASEYPHNACFSGDGRFVAFNSCHFYNGATFSVPVWPSASAAAVRGKDGSSDPINKYLRVYASTWLPPQSFDGCPGAFVLCGNGLMTCVTPAGAILFEQFFGSSAGAVDYCWKTRQLVVTSYSGFMHVFDLSATELAGRVVGYNPRREEYRWILWKGQDPFRW